MSSGLPLDTLASTVKAELKKSDQMLIAAGQHLIEARARVGKGEAGDDVDWKRWLAIHQIGEEKAKVCLRIANDPNPEQALIVHREKHRETQARHSSRQRTNSVSVIPDQSEIASNKLASDWYNYSTAAAGGTAPPRPPVRSDLADPMDDPWVKKMLALLAEGTPTQLDCIKAWLAS